MLSKFMKENDIVQTILQPKDGIYEDDDYPTG